MCVCVCEREREREKERERERELNYILACMYLPCPYLPMPKYLEGVASENSSKYAGTSERTSSILLLVLVHIKSQI